MAKYTQQQINDYVECKMTIEEILKRKAQKEQEAAIAISAKEKELDTLRAEKATEIQDIDKQIEALTK